jgi:hypothetical protein
MARTSVVAREKVGDAGVESAVIRARQLPPSERIRRALQLAAEAVDLGADRERVK